jgi:hypothetical protein
MFFQSTSVLWATEIFFFFFFFFNAETIVQAIVRIVRNGCKNLLHTEAVISSQPVVKDRVKVFSVKVGSRG